MEGGDGIAQAHIAPAEGYSVPLTVTKAGSNGDLAATLRAATTEPFDLAAGPLLRALLLVDGRKASTLAVVMHHAVGDAWSQVGAVLPGFVGAGWLDQSLSLVGAGWNVVWWVLAGGMGRPGVTQGVSAVPMCK